MRDPFEIEGEGLCQMLSGDEEESFDSGEGSSVAALPYQS
jgi:hypothetical protein